MMKKQAFFISGIDTGCGKTYATGLLAKAFKNSGERVITQKLVQTGCEGISEDIIEHRRIMECSLFEQDEVGTTCPYVFPYPASPQLAAKLANSQIDPSKIVACTAKLLSDFETVLIEGAGGLHVPLTANMLTIDYIKMNNYPVILISSTKLGSINHTLLSIESCAFHNLKVIAVLYNKLPDYDEVIENDSFNVISNALKKHYPKSECLKFGTSENNDQIMRNLSEKLKKY